MEVVVRKLRPKRPETPVSEDGTATGTESGKAGMVITDGLWELMQRCWSFPPQQRPGVRRALRYLRRKAKVSVVPPSVEDPVIAPVCCSIETPITTANSFFAIV